MSKWLYERLKRVKQLQLAIERIKGSPADANERTYDYLWSRFERVIAESQHEKNLSSIQEGLKNAPGSSQDPKPKSKGKGEGKGKKGGGKDSQGKPQGKGDNKTGEGQNDEKGNCSSKSNKNSPKGSGNQNPGDKGVCLFWPKGFCRRGTDCPYKHEGPGESASTSQAKATPPAPKIASGTVWSGDLSSCDHRTVYVADGFMRVPGRGERICGLESLVSDTVDPNCGGSFYPAQLSGVELTKPKLLFRSKAATAKGALLLAVSGWLKPTKLVSTPIFTDLYHMFLTHAQDNMLTHIIIMSYVYI